MRPAAGRPADVDAVRPRGRTDGDRARGRGAIEFRHVPPAPGTAPAGTVVFENGLRADIDGWSAALAGLAPATRQGWALFAYNRPGIIKKPEDFPVTARIAKSPFMSRMAARETEAIHATGEQVLALPWPAQIPVERLINAPKSPSAVAIDLGVVNDDPATIARVRALSLYPAARTTVLDSDHPIQMANPEAVVQAVLRLSGTNQGPPAQSHKGIPPPPRSWGNSATARSAGLPSCARMPQRACQEVEP